MKLTRAGTTANGGAPGAIVGAAMVAGGLFAAAWFRFGLPLPVCPVREWTGFPCVTCGATRMIEALVHGRFIEAAAWNPLVFLGAAALLFWGGLSAARLALGQPAWRLVVEPRERRGLALLAVSAVALDWAYLIWRGV